MVIVPVRGFDLDDIEDDMEDGFNWGVVENHRNMKQIALSLPKFKLQHEMNLKPILEMLGVKDLFTRGVANLKGAFPFRYGRAK